MFFHHKRKTKQLDRLRTLLALCELNEQHMKSANEYYREHGTVQGHPHITPEAAKIIDDGIANGEFPNGLPYSTYDILHDYYEIQRLKRKIEELEAQREYPERGRL